jgi:2',3'-cyclic-nucleotide 2'-phosphodiesterase (5'-nucleotidase family)
VLGGLARRVTTVEKARSEGRPVLVVDSGDLFFDKAEGVDANLARTKAALLGKAYRKMGAAAVNVGDLDLAQGLDFLRQEAREGLPLISANLLDSSKNAPIFPPFVIKEIEGVRVGFFGLLTPQAGSGGQNPAGRDVVVRDPVPAAREALEQLKGKADLVVLLSDLGMSKDIELVQNVPGIHFVLGGHDGRYAATPIQERGATIVQSYSKGMYLGKLQLTLGNPSSTFVDGGKGERIKQQIANLDTRLTALQKAQGKSSGAQVETVVRQIEQQKAQLEQELKDLSSSPVQGNRFVWTLESLDSGIPESEEVRTWAREAKIEKD